MCGNFTGNSAGAFKSEVKMLRALLAPIVAFLLLVGLFIIGFASAQSGLLIVALLCAWPLLWGVTAWTVRGLRDSYDLIVPKSRAAATAARRPTATREVLN